MISPVIASYALSLGADELTASLIATLYSMIAIPIFVYGSTAHL
jgi:preprotein translocase subunit SecD